MKTKRSGFILFLFFLMATCCGAPPGQPQSLPQGESQSTAVTGAPNSGNESKPNNHHQTNSSGSSTEADSSIGSNSQLAETSENQALTAKGSNGQLQMISGASNALKLSIDAEGHTAKIKSLEFTSNGRYLVSASYDKTIRIWRVWDGSLVRTIRGQSGEGPLGRIYTAALSPNSQKIALAGWIQTDDALKRNDNDYAIRIVNFYSGDVSQVFEGHRNVINSLKYSRNSQFLVSGSGDATAKIWNANTGRLIRTLRGHSGSVYAVDISPDGYQVATASKDGTVRLWNAHTGRLIKTMTGHRGPVRAIAFTPNGNYLVSGGSDKTVRLWDSQNGRAVKLLGTQSSTVSSLSVSPDSRLVLTGSSGGKIINNVISIPTGERLTQFTEHDNIVLATAISPDGQLAATAGGDNHEIILWQLKTAEVKQRIRGQGEAVWSVGFKRDGSGIAWGKTYDGNADANPGSRSTGFNGPLERPFTLYDGSRYTVRKGYSISHSSEYSREIHSKGPWQIGLNPSAGPNTLTIIKGGRVLNNIVRGPKNGQYHRSYTLSPGVDMVVSGGANGVLSSYDLHSGRKRNDFIGHTGDVLSVALSDDGSKLVSGSADQTVRVWNAHTGALLLSIFEGANRQWVAWTPLGYYASSTYGDRYVGWQLNRGSNRAADFYKAAAYSKHYRFPKIVGLYLKNEGDMSQVIQHAERYFSSYDRPTNWTDLSKLDIFAPPKAQFIQPLPYSFSVVNGDSVQIEATASAINDEPILDIWVLINGRPIDKGWWQKIGKTPYKRLYGKTAKITMEVPLPARFNRISVVAKNQFGNGLPQTIEVERKGKGTVRYQEVTQPNLYVLAIGISQNLNPTNTLTYAHEDAKGIAAVLNKNGGNLYKNVYTQVLTNDMATKRAILDGLSWLTRKTTQKDVAIIFVSGHGILDKDNAYYFLPYDSNSKQLETAGVKWANFQKTLEQLPSKVILMADTCHSGNITGKHTAKGRKQDMTHALRNLVNTGSGVVVLTASTGNEQSYESDKWKHGAFSKALIEGLNGRADYNKDNGVYMKELDLYVSNRVEKLTGGRQHTTTEIPATMPNFPITFH